MGEIYLQAEKVVVWLGEGDAATTRAINLLQQIGDVNNLNLNIDNESVRTANLDTRLRLQQQLQSHARELTQRRIAATFEPLNMS
jgi:shikimate kinase